MKDNERQEIEKFGQLQENGIFTMTIIGEIEGHQLSAQNAKTTKYEHMIPALAKVEQDESIKGILFIGVIQSYRNIEKIQDRSTTFISDHCKMKKERVEELMLHIGQQVKDVGMILSGEEAVKEGLIDEMGGIKEATDRLIEIINQSENK